MRFHSKIMVGTASKINKTFEHLNQGQFLIKIFYTWRVQGNFFYKLTHRDMLKQTNQI